MFSELYFGTISYSYRKSNALVIFSIYDFLCIIKLVMKMKYSAIILAAGKGSRTNLEYNKVFYTFSDGEKLLQKTIRPFLLDEECTQLIVVIGKEEKEIVEEILPKDMRIECTYGGETRQDSVYNGLLCVKEEHVMIHDGARCYVSDDEIKRCKESLEKEKACLLMVPAIDTIKVVKDGYVESTPVRSTLYYAQTPQCFETSLIKECYQKGKEEGWQASDDTSLVERYSDVKVKVVRGEYANKKVTTKEDLK